jgi:hypothetical protein
MCFLLLLFLLNQLPSNEHNNISKPSFVNGHNHNHHNNQHQKTLYDVNEKRNGLNNDNFTNNCSYNDRKIGKSSSIETDNDDDSEENFHEYDLSENIGKKHLQPLTFLNFRQQALVGHDK